MPATRGDNIDGRQPPARDETAGVLDGQAAMPMRRRLVHARLLTLLKFVRLSGELAYRRQLGLVELHRRLLALIGNYGALTSIELVSLSGHEKAQISRAVKALTKAGLIERESLRAPIGLTANGQAVFEQILEVARQRNAALAHGIGAANVAEFLKTTRRLIERAAKLLVDERLLSGGAADGAGSTDAPPLPEAARHPDPARPFSHMVTQLLLSFVSYLQRSATIAYRRETGLSNFEWQVLSQIGEHQPVTLARLIAMIARDKSQVGRTVGRLEEVGMVVRTTIGGRRDILLATTDEGTVTYQRMCGDAMRRDDYLLSTITPRQRERFLITLDGLTANAEALLVAERARAS